MSFMNHIGFAVLEIVEVDCEVDDRKIVGELQGSKITTTPLS